MGGPVKQGVSNVVPRAKVANTSFDRATSDRGTAPQLNHTVSLDNLSSGVQSYGKLPLSPGLGK